MSSDVFTLTADNFSTAVLEAKQPVLVDFWASWCGPCKMLAPVVSQLASEYAGKAVVAKLSTEDCPEIAEKYDITAIPTVLIFANGEVKENLLGVRPIEAYRQALAKLGA